jgi:hypothetical protein
MLLYTRFDAAIGHYRRYTKSSLRSIAPQGLQEKKCVYLDSLGLLASLGNKLFLHSPVPSKGETELAPERGAFGAHVVAHPRFEDLTIVPYELRSVSFFGHEILRVSCGIARCWCRPSFLIRDYERARA